MLPSLVIFGSEASPLLDPEYVETEPAPKPPFPKYGANEFPKPFVFGMT